MLTRTSPPLGPPPLKLEGDIFSTRACPDGWPPTWPADRGFGLRSRLNFEYARQPHLGTAMPVCNSGDADRLRPQQGHIQHGHRQGVARSEHEKRQRIISSRGGRVADAARAQPITRLDRILRLRRTRVAFHDAGAVYRISLAPVERGASYESHEDRCHNQNWFAGHRRHAFRKPQPAEATIPNTEWEWRSRPRQAVLSTA